MYPPLTGVTRQLVILNVVLFIGSLTILSGFSAMLSAFYPESAYFRPFQIITHMFMHGSPGHLLFNMLSLYFFGSAVEMVWGPKRFLTYYLACGLGSWALHTGIIWWRLSNGSIGEDEIDIPMLGASGAIFGIFVAFALHFPNHQIQLLIPPIPVKAKYFVPVLAAIDLFSGVSGRASGVAHWAHIGGGLMGFFIMLYWFPSILKGGGGRRPRW